MAAPSTQLWASLPLLSDAGPPRATLAEVSARRRLAALRAASGVIASYIRGPYELPLVTSINEVGSDALGGSADVDALPALREAAGYAVRVETGGVVGADPISISWGEDWDPEAPSSSWVLPHQAVLPPTGVLELGGVRFAFSGALTAGGVAWAIAGVADEVARAVMHVAAYDLLWNRGLDPGSDEGQRLTERYEKALAWAKDVQARAAKLDQQSDATPGKNEHRPRYGTRGTSNGWLGPHPYGSGGVGMRRRGGCGC